jgi:hypothetical protein
MYPMLPVYIIQNVRTSIMTITNSAIIIIIIIIIVVLNVC